jgi:hypothetical protein
MTETSFLRGLTKNPHNRYNRLATNLHNCVSSFKNFDFGGKIRKIGGILKPPFQLPNQNLQP